MTQAPLNELAAVVLMINNGQELSGRQKELQNMAIEILSKAEEENNNGLLGATENSMFSEVTYYDSPQISLTLSKRTTAGSYLMIDTSENIGVMLSRIEPELNLRFSPIQGNMLKELTEQHNNRLYHLTL